MVANIETDIEITHARQLKNLSCVGYMRLEKPTRYKLIKTCVLDECDPVHYKFLPCQGNAKNCQWRQGFQVRLLWESKRVTPARSAE